MIHSRPTSAWANRRRSRYTAAELRRRICRVLATRGPKTREAVGKILRVRGDSLRPRVRELIRSWHVRVCRALGKTAAGNKAELLAVTRLGMRL